MVCLRKGLAAAGLLVRAGLMVAIQARGCEMDLSSSYMPFMSGIAVQVQFYAEDCGWAECPGPDPDGRIPAKIPRGKEARTPIPKAGRLRVLVPAANENQASQA